MDIPKEEQKIQYDTLQVAHAQIEYSKFGFKCDQTHARAVFFLVHLKCWNCMTFNEHGIFFVFLH